MSLFEEYISQTDSSNSQYTDYTDHVDVTVEGEASESIYGHDGHADSTYVDKD